MVLFHALKLFLITLSLLESSNGRKFYRFPFESGDVNFAQVQDSCSYEITEANSGFLFACLQMSHHHYASPTKSRVTHLWLVIASDCATLNPGPVNDIQSVLNQPGLKIAYLNIHSLPGHLGEFGIILLMLCAFLRPRSTQRNQDSDDELFIDGYNIIRKDRPGTRRGGGTAIYYKDMLWALTSKLRWGI